MRTTNILAATLSLAIGLSLLPTAQAEPVCTVKIAGGEQTVFLYRDEHKRCGKMDFPDVPAYAFIDKDNRVQLLASNANGNYRSIGDSLDSVERDCSRPVLESNKPSAPPGAYYNRVWLTSPWTNDGQTIYALAHNEFDAWFYPTREYCQTGDKTKCWYPNAVQFKSTDAGQSYQVMRGAGGGARPAIGTPYKYIPDGGAANNQQGMVSQSNILSKQEDGKTYYYTLVVRGIGHGHKEGTCLFRSDDISNPMAWRGWNGSDFSVAMNRSAYGKQDITNSEVCQPIFDKFYCSGWTYNNLMHKYLAVCRSNNFASGEGREEAFVYSTSTDMIHWSQPQLLEKINWQGTFRASQMNSGVTAQTYPSMLDPTSQGRNFEYSGANPYLYYTRFNPKERGVAWENRDLVRVPLTVSCGG